MYLAGKPRPDRTLVTAAEAAALQWTFKLNFGLQPSDSIHFNYIQDVLVFDFVLPPDKTN